MNLFHKPKEWAYCSKEEFFLLRAYVSILEAKLQNAQENLHQYVEKDQLEFQNEAQDGSIVKEICDIRHIEGVTDIDYDLDALLTETLPNYERRSSLITVYGIFEYELSKFCGKLEKYLGKKKSWEKFSKKNRLSKIKRAHNWLTIECDLDLEIVSSIFDEIDVIRDIRNCSAHNYGVIKQDSINVIRYIERHADLNRVDGFVILSDKFLRYFTDLCYQYFEGLERAVLNK